LISGSSAGRFSSISGGINLGGELRLLIVGDVAAVIAARVGTTF
jgi:hypothetical protein